MDAAVRKVIFLIEDEKIAIDSISEFLKKAGYIMEAARNGNEALKLLPVVRPDLIILDLVMPEINGIDLLKEIQKKGSEFSKVPVIVLTNLSGDQSEFETLGLKIAGYFVKTNISLEDLAKKVGEVLG